MGTRSQYKTVSSTHRDIERETELNGSFTRNEKEKNFELFPHSYSIFHSRKCAARSHRKLYQMNHTANIFHGMTKEESRKKETVERDAGQKQWVEENENKAMHTLNLANVITNWSMEATYNIYVTIPIRYTGELKQNKLKNLNTDVLWREIGLSERACERERAMERNTLLWNHENGCRNTLHI